MSAHIPHDMDKPDNSLNAPGIRTSAVTILSSEHGRMRRAQRAIDKRELQAAVKYGNKEQAGHCRRTGAVRWKYTYAGVVFVTDETSRHEITAWPIPGVGLDVPYVDITENMKQSHLKACQNILTRKSSWTSHTVVVVDQSGSMRKTDVEGGATRSDSVWVVLALEFIAKQLHDGSAKSTDVLSLIVMREGAEVVIDKQPMDWTLFNSIIDLLHTSRPMEHGNYLPALQLAEELLMSNSHGSCALMLCFLSDGQPSDKVGRSLIFGETIQGKKLKLVVQRIETLASRFGRRLTIASIGFSGRQETFQVLKGMASTAKMYGSAGVFKNPMLTPDALSDVFTSLSQTLTSTKTEMTALGSSSQRVVRSVLREPAVVPDEFKMSDNWLFYPSRSVKCTHWDDEGGGWTIATRLPAEVKGVAMRKRIFGEGAERMVRQFRFVAHDDTFFGEKMVAKESRYLEDVSKVSNDDLKRYQKTFCQTQLKAQKLAEKFNKRIENLPGIKAATTPRLEFLACSVYLVQDIQRGYTGLLVEKMLPPEKYKKWNNNAGFVDGQVQHLLGNAGGFTSPARALINPLHCQMGGLGLASANKPLASHQLPALVEDSEEELDTDDDDSCKSDYGFHGDDSAGSHGPINIKPEDIPQAFSHFTYIQSKRKMLVCDLQGVLTSADANPPVFELTDPVIHYKSSKGNRNTYGRTDHGTKGMSEFFKTHKCSSLCRMINQRWCNGDTFSEQQGSTN